MICYCEINCLTTKESILRKIIWGKLFLIWSESLQKQQGDMDFCYCSLPPLPGRQSCVLSVCSWFSFCTWPFSALVSPQSQIMPLLLYPTIPSPLTTSVPLWKSTLSSSHFFFVSFVLLHPCWGLFISAASPHWLDGLRMGQLGCTGWSDPYKTHHWLTHKARLHDFVSVPCI